MGKQAVLVVGFNRPDLLRQNFGAIAEYQPKKLYFACDGPRVTNGTDAQLVSEAKKSVQSFSWQCAVETRFQQHNVGLRRNMVEAIDWFFANEPEGIILEDDCIPSPDFFSLMEHVIEKYRDEPKVWGVTGSNPSGAPVLAGDSYGFIRSAVIWGWASWADRWASYDRNLAEYSRSGLAGQKKRWPDAIEYHAFDWHLRQITQGKLLTSWAYPWSWTVIHNNGLWAIPSKNLVSNVGFRSDATHTSSATRLDQSVGNLGEIQSPSSIERDRELQHHIHTRHDRVLRPLWLNYLRNAYRLSPFRGIHNSFNTCLRRAKTGHF